MKIHRVSKVFLLLLVVAALLSCNAKPQEITLWYRWVSLLQDDHC